MDFATGKAPALEEVVENTYVQRGFVALIILAESARAILSEAR